MEKRFLEWLFVLAMGYIFVELGRMLAGVQISGTEWVGFFIFAGVACWLWHIGKRMDENEKIKQRKERMREDEERTQILAE